MSACAADGTLGPRTLRALEQLRRTVTGGSPSERREEERLRGSERALAGRVIVLDPGHGGADRGATSGTAWSRPTSCSTSPPGSRAGSARSG